MMQKLEKNRKNPQKNKISKQKANKELVDFVLDELAKRQNERKNFENQWLLNANFVLGNQFCGINSSGDVADYDAQYFWQEHESFNNLAYLYESRLAKLARVRPSMTVLPSGSEEGDIQSAKVSKNILKSSIHKLSLSEKISRATKWSELCGTAFYKIFWDSNLGRIVGIDENGNNIHEGDVELIVCPPFEIYPDNSSAEDLQDCTSLIHARAYHTTAIKSMYGVEVEGKELDVFSLDNLGKQSGLGFYSHTPKILKTTKSNHALVVEYYERPSTDFPNGRLIIVAGDTLIYNGELPFMNGDDGERVFPFARQCAFEQATNFWGASVIERLIPLQRAYNAVKNRKHEFLNRISMGVLTVEDGSVDTDDLEEEGVSPGKVLVYRQGSTPPIMMNYGSVPNEFTVEEDRLIDEMIRISGTGDLNTNLSALRNMSGVALQVLIEQDEAKLTMSAEQIRSAVKTIAKHILRLYKQFTTSKRVCRIIGENSAVQMFYFSASDLTSEDVIFETENEMNETSAQRRSMLLELLNHGLLHDENGKLNNRMRAKILELLGYGIWEQGQELTDLHRNKAQQENVDLLQNKVVPEVESFDDHATHIDEHISFILTNKFDKNSSHDVLFKQMLIEHINQHKLALSQSKNVENMKNENLI